MISVGPQEVERTISELGIEVTIEELPFGGSLTAAPGEQWYTDGKTSVALRARGGTEIVFWGFSWAFQVIDNRVVRLVIRDLCLIGTLVEALIPFTQLPHPAN